MERFSLSEPARRIVSAYQAALGVLPEAGVEVGADIRLETKATPAGLAWETFRERGGRERPVENGLLPWHDVAEAWGAQNAAPLDADTVAIWDALGDGGKRR